MRMRSIVGCFVALAACAQSAGAADFYASTSGSPAGDGSFGNPWDLATALHHPAAVQPGDTIWVRGGTYSGAHTSRLAGTPGNPITVRAYRRERAVLDYAGNSNCNPAEPDECSPNNKRCNALTVPACSHDVVFRDLELTHSGASGRVSLPPGGCADAPECCYVDGVAPPLKAECGAAPAGIARAQWQPLHIAGDRVAVVNCIVHDGGVGVTTDQRALDTVIYGALVFNNGWVDPVSGQGHGISLENLTPSWRESRKQVRNSVLWNNFGDGVRSATSWGRFSDNLFLEDVIAFNNGGPTAAFYAGAPVLYAAAQATRYANVFLQADEKMRFIQLRRCRLFQPQGSAVQRQALGGVKDANFEFSKDLIVEDSYIATSGTPLGLIRWDRIRTTGTTLIGGASPQAGDTEALVEIEKTECASLFSPAGDWNALVWEDNDYFFTGAGTQPFGLRTSSGPAWTYRNFADWRTAIYDRDALSSYTAGLPAANAVFVQPNEHEPGRAHIAVYNWQGLSAVGVDLSSVGLVAGQGFRIHNLQAFDDGAATDPFGTVVASGTYNPGAPVVSVSMTDSTVTGPTGLGAGVASTLPQFGAFLVRSLPCGDGVLDPGEGCDDGNLTAADGCGASCAVEPCWSCGGAPSICAPSSLGTPCASDGNACTDDVCDGAGACGVDNSATCDDGMFCNGADVCGGGTCQHAGNPCPAGDTCQACNETADACAAPAGTPCASDGNACTDDVCDGAGACAVDNSAPCDDGLFCNGADVCSGGTCQHAGNPCPPGDTCQACNEATHACAAPAGTACASDGNLCTDDACDGAGTCQHPHNTAPCDDGNACTDDDRCAAGSCGGDTIDCDDDNACTDDSCHPASGCAHANNSGACDDGNACTQSDVCGEGACVGSNPTICDDANPCTQDSCSTASGCVFAPVPRPVCATSRSLLLIKQNADDTKDSLKWKWLKGAAAPGDFGTPTGATDSTLCVYDQNGLVLRADVPGGEMCAGVPCWKATASGFKYKDTAAASSGIRLIVEKHSASAAKVLVSGKGGNLPDPATSTIAPPVTVQFVNNTSAGCVQGSVAAGQVIKQDATQFVGKGSP